jgi:hypothetical protein
MPPAARVPDMTPLPAAAPSPDLTPVPGAAPSPDETPAGGMPAATGAAAEPHLPPARDPDKTPPGDIDQLLADTAAEDMTEAGTSMPTAPPPLANETPAPADSDLAIDVDMSGEHSVVEEDDIVMADEVEDVVEAEPAPAVKTEPPPKPKRSLPPPLPRS